MKLRPNFTRKELECPCCQRCEMTDELLDKLQALRDRLGFPLIVTSGFRCLEHNKKVGGSPRSQHLKGNAVDIRVIKFSSHTRHRLIKNAFSTGFKGIGTGKNRLHLDMREGLSSLWNC